MSRLFLQETVVLLERALIPKLDEARRLRNEGRKVIAEMQMGYVEDIWHSIA
jgi:hypothetical protein